MSSFDFLMWFTEHLNWVTIISPSMLCSWRLLLDRHWTPDITLKIPGGAVTHVRVSCSGHSSEFFLPVKASQEEKKKTRRRRERLDNFWWQKLTLVSMCCVEFIRLVSIQVWMLGVNTSDLDNILLRSSFVKTSRRNYLDPNVWLVSSELHSRLHVTVTYMLHEPGQEQTE